MNFKKYISRSNDIINESISDDLKNAIKKITFHSSVLKGEENRKLSSDAKRIINNIKQALRDLNIDIDKTKTVKIPSDDVQHMGDLKNKDLDSNAFIKKLKVYMRHYNTPAMIIITNDDHKTKMFEPDDKIYILAKYNQLMNPSDYKSNTLKLLQITKGNESNFLQGRGRQGVYNTASAKSVDLGNINIKAIWCLSDDNYDENNFNRDRNNTVKGFEYFTNDDNPLIPRRRKRKEDVEESECCEKCGNKLCDCGCDGYCESNCDEKCENIDESCICFSFNDEVPCSFLKMPIGCVGCDICDCGDLVEPCAIINPDKFVDDNDSNPCYTYDDTEEPEESKGIDLDKFIDDSNDEDIDDSNDEDIDDSNDEDIDDSNDEDIDDSNDEDIDDEGDDYAEDDIEEDEEEYLEAEELNEGKSPFQLSNFIRTYYANHPLDDLTEEQRTNLFLQTFTSVMQNEKDRGIGEKIKGSTSGRGASFLSHKYKKTSTNLHFYQLSPIRLRDLARIKCIYQQPTFIGYVILEPNNHNRVSLLTFDFYDMKYIVRTYTMCSRDDKTVVDPRKGEKAYARPLHIKKNDIEYGRNDKLINRFGKDCLFGALVVSSSPSDPAVKCIRNTLKALYGDVSPLSDKHSTLVQWGIINNVMQKSKEKSDFLKAVDEWDIVNYKLGHDDCVCGYEDITLGYVIRNRITKEIISPVGAKCIQIFANHDLGNFLKNIHNPEDTSRGFGQEDRDMSIINYNRTPYKRDTRSQKQQWRDYIKSTKMFTDDYIGDIRKSK